MNETKATRYQRLRRRAHAAGVVSGGLMLAVPRAHARVARGSPAGRGALARPFAAPVARGRRRSSSFVGLVVLLWELAALPAVLYLGAARRPAICARSSRPSTT